MTPTKLSGTLGLAALAALACPFALAQDTGWYGGASVGRTAATIDDARITSGLAGAGLGTVSISDRDRDTGYKLFGGYQLNRNLSLEGGWFDLGRYGFTATTTPAGTLTGDIRVRGLNLDAVGTFPVTDRLSVLGRLGVTHARTTGAFRGTGAVGVTDPNPVKRDTNLKAGLGLAYAFTPALTMRVEGERYRINDAVGNKGHIDMLSLGLVWRFGERGTPVVRTASPAPYVAPAPVMAAAPMPAAAPPPPAPAPTPAPMAPIRVTFEADTLFAFDRSTIRPEGKMALDKFVADLQGIRWDSMSIVGHTDRIGSNAYNLALSSRRADAVRDYLVGTAGIPANKMSTRGVNGAEPVTKPGECVGTRPTPKLIACLQPDRRVEVEVTGSR